MPRYRDDYDDDDDRDNRRPRRRGRARCPYCESEFPPVRREKISTTGWVIFWVGLFTLCWPFFLVGLFVKDSFRECAECGEIL